MKVLDLVRPPTYCMSGMILLKVHLHNFVSYEQARRALSSQIIASPPSAHKTPRAGPGQNWLEPP